MPAVSEPPWQELRGNLRSFIGRRVRNKTDVDDLVQRVLLQIVRHLGSLRDADRLHAWVYRAARNVIIDHYRSSSVRREVSSDTDDPSSAAVSATLLPSGGDEESAALRELATCLEPMLRQLSPAYREALTLADIEGLSQAAAAERAGISLSGMKSRVQRGRRQLKQVLEACCRIDLDRHGAVIGFEARVKDGCGCNNCD